MDETSQTPPVELPNGPARVTTDFKKDRFKLEYAGDLIFQATVRLVRADAELGLKEAGVKLLVVSKFEGWGVVTQSIRVAVVAALPGDILRVTGHTIQANAQVEIMAEPHSGVYCRKQDWLLSIDLVATAEWSCEEVPVRGEPDATLLRAVLKAEAAEMMLRFRPHYRAKHA
jgi:hypothetical protein